jgi:hypothetical protein
MEIDHNMLSLMNEALWYMFKTYEHSGGDDAKLSTLKPDDYQVTGTYNSRYHAQKWASNLYNY